MRISDAVRTEVNHPNLPWYYHLDNIHNIDMYLNTDKRDFSLMRTMLGINRKFKSSPKNRLSVLNNPVVKIL